MSARGVKADISHSITLGPLIPGSRRWNVMKMQVRTIEAWRARMSFLARISALANRHLARKVFRKSFAP